MKKIHSRIHHTYKDSFAGQTITSSLYRQDTARLSPFKSLKIKSFRLFYKFHLLSVRVCIKLRFR